MFGCRVNIADLLLLALMLLDASFPQRAAPMRTDFDEPEQRRSYFLTLIGTAAGLFTALADFLEAILRLMEFVF